MFRAVPLPIIRSFPLYIRHWYMSCTFDDSFQARPGWSCLKAAIKSAWHIPVPNVQWKTPDDGQRNCPKHVEFLDKNKFGKLVRMLMLLKINSLRCTVTWTWMLMLQPSRKLCLKFPSDRTWKLGKSYEICGSHSGLDGGAKSCGILRRVYW